MKKIIYMISLLTGILTISIGMTACSGPIKAENLNLNEEVAKVTQENQVLKEEIRQLQQNNQELDAEIAKLDPSREQDRPIYEFAENASIFNIYGANVDTYEPELLSQVSIKNSLSLEQKLKTVSEYLSKAQFGNLGIEVSEIEEKDGKKIAIVNLTETPNENDVSWNTGYFQGSTGGTITSISLEKTFLQKGYEGEWIDGVRFLYEGQRIQFDHVGMLGDIIYR